MYTLNEIKNKIVNLGSEIQTDRWNGTKYSYEFKCIECGEWFSVGYSKFISGQRKCKKCNGIIDWSLDKAKNYAISVGSDIKENKWYGATQKYTFLCSDCGEWFNKSFGDFYYKKEYQCSKCGRRNGGKKRQVLYSKVIKIINYHNTEIRKDINREMTEDQWEGAYKHYYIRCVDCNEWVYKTFNEFTQGKLRCVKCGKKFAGKNKIKTHEQFCNEVYKLVKNDYSVISIYQYTQIHLLMKHNICGHEWMIIPNNFLNGRRCPVCSISKGEQKIKEWLDSYQIKYILQFTYNNLLSNKQNLLRFDFAIFKKNGDFLCLIEYDGEFHYMKMYENDGYEELIIHDERKNKYCKNNNIRLLRIPYWEFDNITNILTKELL